MTETMVRRGAASMAKSMGLMCVADSGLGKLTEGQCPVTRTGDYSDVVVVDADGRIIPWQRVACFDAKEMRRTRREIVDIAVHLLLQTWRETGWRCCAIIAKRRTSEWDSPKEDAA